ncbi:thioredoxin [Novosphingobium sp. ERN07]|uniref:MJ0042-type zinc finger domain-containing protein n=1 Tax=Novosphingobium sp. ERN07 TaxID=2726187 RepID=UPI00145682D4|nr:MJ0042-type zinc finger domain-containing protein [Novosphingobium sp. ERN07]NLR73488.1 thioredoxin [Novosphingobium sp. ERN07]
MIIACPACSTRYVVPDSAIGVDGRTVRCARCRHAWFQNGPDLPERESAEVAVAAPSEASVPAQADATPPALVAEAASTSAPTRAEPVVPPPLPEAARRTPPPVYDDTDTSPFEHQPPFRPRRNPTKMWTIAAVAFALTVAGLAGAAWYYGLPKWLPGAAQTFGADRPDLVLSFPPEKQDRRQLPNGTEYFGASGTVTNTGKDVRALPQILIVLRDSNDKVVKTWDVPPPQDELAPGESVTINAAVTDVPKAAKVAEIGWKPD